jgi:NAD(P)-dependent dehydrogenase (short-subunit alcohol dehydrogenase family)
MSGISDEAPMDLASLFRLDGQAFLVAGAGQGMGEAAAKMLHALGARVVCADRDLDKAERVARQVDGVPAHGDITVEEAVVDLLDLTVRELGSLDGIVDVVGGARFIRIPELQLDEFELQFTGNLRHAYLLGRHGGMRMADRGGGSLVFVSSIAAMFGSRAHPAYCAAKVALVSWVRSLAEEFGPSGVRANSVAPGATLTTRMREAWTDDALEEMARPTMLGRLGKVEELAATIAFLASPAAGNITGQTIVADGGAIVRDPIYGGGKNRGEADIRRMQQERIAAGLPWP